MPDAAIPGLEGLLEHRSWVRDLARRLVRDAADAEDLAQETWVRVMRSPPDPDRDPRPWLRRVLKNLASNRWRGERRRTAHESAWRDVRPQRTPAELVEEADQHQRLVRRVLELEEPFKTTLVLRFYEGLSPREIAERMGIAEGTVHSRVARAVGRLRDRLDEEEGGDRKRWIAALLPLARQDAGVATAAATAGTLSGVMLMVTNTKLCALTALGLVLLIAGGLWVASNTDGDVPDSRAALEKDLVARPTLKGRPGASTTIDTASPEPEVREPPAPPALVGRVLDPRSLPIPDAEVFLLPEGVLGVNDGVFRDARLPLAHTDAEGAFRLPSARRGGQLVAYAEGRIPSALSLDDASLDEPIELVLREARTITVRVEGPQAHWPARCGAAIRTDYDQTWERTADPTRLAYIAFVDPQEEPQDVEQTLQVPTLAPLRVELRLPAGWASVPRRVDLSSGVDRAEFRLVPSGELRVRVIDDVTGEPPATGSHVGMTIQEVGVQHPIWNRATIGGNELHERSRLTPGHYGVEVAVSGYLPARVPFEISSKGAKVDLVVRVVPRDLDDTGRVLLRVIDTERAPGNVRALARSGAPPGFAAEYVAFLRASGTTQWTGANAKVLEDGRVDLRPRLLETWQSGVRPGHYDLYVARRDTGTAAYIPGVRVFGDEEKEVTVTLQPGTLFRVTDLASDEEPLTEMTVSAAGIGQLPMVEFRADGHWTLTTPADAEYLLARPLQPRILGPFPAEEIEISVTTESGKERLVRIRGASILR